MNEIEIQIYLKWFDEFVKDFPFSGIIGDAYVEAGYFPPGYVDEFNLGIAPESSTLAAAAHGVKRSAPTTISGRPVCLSISSIFV